MAIKFLNSLNADSGVLYVDADNNRVGIGTASPSYTLQVIGDASVSTWLYVNNIYPTSSTNDLLLNTGAGRTITINPTSTGKTVIPNGNVGIGNTAPGAKLDIIGESGIGLRIKKPNLDDVLRVYTQGSGIYMNNGDVHISDRIGIGTTSPAEKLHVVDGTSNLKFTNDLLDGFRGLELSGTNPTVKFDGEGNTWNLAGLNSAFALWDKTNTNYRLWVSNAGNVGIGTTSPSQKLSVEGNVELGTGGYIYGDTTNPYLRLNNSAGALLGYGSSYLVNGGSLEFRTSTGTKFRISSSGGGYVAGGNFGIGTTSPSSPLTVVGRVDFHNDLRLRGTDSATNQGVTRFYVDSSNKFYIDTANDGNNRFVIDSAGKVGIGTTTPAAKLQIDGHGSLDGEIRINASGDNTEFGLIRFVGDSSTYEKYLIAYNSAHVSQADEISLKNTAGDITFYTGTGGGTTEKVRIDTSGNVGIGTTSPGAKLEVLSGGGIHITDDSLGRTLIIKPSLSGAVHEFTSDNTASGYSFSNNSSELMRIAADGNVGIGTTSPSHKLQVAGNIYANAGQIYIDNGYYLSGGDATSRIYLGNNGSQGVQIYTNSTERMRIADGGNVGIGTTSPSQKLEVSGTILQSVLNYSPNDDTNDVVGTRYFKTHTSTTNAPVSTFGMGINVEYGSGNSMQLMSSRSGADALYMRKQANSSWGSWIRIRDENQITDTDISNWDDGYLKWSGTSGSNDWDNIDENSFIKGHTTTLNYPPDLSQSFLSGIAAMYSAGNGWQLASTRSNGSNLYHRHVSNDTWYSWKRILDSDDIYVDNSNGNIGIDTTSPAYPLDVNGQMRATAYRIGGGTILSGSSTVQLGSGGATGIITFNTTSGEGMRLNGSNVGIGTTSPSTKLEVSSSGAEGILISKDTGTPSNSGRLFFETDTVSEGFSFLNSNGLFTIRSQAQAGVTSGNTRVAINGSGNVGIGTTSPSDLLHIQNTDAAIRLQDSDGTNQWSRIRQAGSNLILTSRDGTSNGQLYFQQYDGTTTTDAMVIRSSGNVGIGTANPIQKLQVDGNIYSNGGNVYINGNQSFVAVGNMKFETWNGSAYGERMRITASGNVGIGTTSPDHLLTLNQKEDAKGIKIYGYDDKSTSTLELHVNGGGNAKLMQTNPGGSGYLQIHAQNYLEFAAASLVYTSSRVRIYDAGQLDFGSGGDYKIKYDSTGDILNIHTDDNKGISISSTGSLQLNAYGAGILKTDSSGNVSLDTSTYATQTYVTDAIADLVDSAPATLDTLNELAAALGDDANFSTTVTNSIATKLPLAGGTLTGDLTISKTTPILTFNSSDVLVDQGIVFSNQGNFDASIKHGASSADMIFDIGRNSTWGGAAIFKLDTYQSYRMFRDSHQWSVLGSEKMRVASNGNVGIGTTAPIAKLDVAGDTRSTGFQVNSGGKYKIGNLSQYITGYNDTAIDIVTGGTVSLRVADNGNVGIGTTTPSEKLEVDGNVKADSFIGGNEAGIYTFTDTVDASTSEDIFSISNDHGAQAFRVTFVCSTSSYSVAKTYEVVHAFGQDPVFFKVVDTGAFGGHDFDATFATEAGGGTDNNKKIICTITNNSATINANIATTVFLGGSPTTITVTAL